MLEKNKLVRRFLPQERRYDGVRVENETKRRSDRG